jgi:uncharacterized protein
MTIGNLVEIEQLAPGAAILDKLGRIEAYTRRYISAHWEFLNNRAREGFVHEGHGDLRADSIYFTANGLRIIDCLEFDEGLRYGDIANEVAFLAMDVDRLGRPDLSRLLLTHFVGDRDFPRLTRFYKSYRAAVRAKVELLRSRQERSLAQEQQTALANAAGLLDLALDYIKGPKALLIVCGASGTGKSTLATALGAHLNYDIISSDVLRKRLAGVEPNTPAAALYHEGIYTPEFTRRVYASLLTEAKRLLSKNKGVILDATFGMRGQRQGAIEMAEQANVEPLFIECQADRAAVMRRLSARGEDSQRISDATVEIYLEQIKEFEPLTGIPAEWHQVVETTHDIGPAVDEIERRVCAAKL